MNQALSVFFVGVGLLALAWGALSRDSKLQLADPPLSPIAGGVAIVGGAILAISPKRS